MRNLIFLCLLIALAVTTGLVMVWPGTAWALVLTIALFVVAVRDVTQRRHAVIRNFPLIGHLRYLMELIRPEINQYFIESDTDGMPFNRVTRSMIYQRAKSVLDTIPFGTEVDVNAPGYEWVGHSMYPREPFKEEPRVRIGGPECSQPYDASHLNVSAMSYGSLSKNAILALNKGARLGGFFHNTGEGGVSPYHLEPGGDLVWQIGTACFGARDRAGNFDPVRFGDTASQEAVRMIEVKLSQGAKPGHGGILPAEKLTPEIARIRGVEMGADVISPPYHRAFRDAAGCLDFVARLRDLSGGKPVGLKLCVGRRREFEDLARAMVKSGITPDFITVDGGEGGTGAAPVEFANTVGSPLDEGLAFVHATLVGYGLRERIRIIASGKVVNGFSIFSRLALGADLCNSARAMMMALGCIQALRCNTNTCPVGVATQDPRLAAGLVVEDKAVRVANFHRETVAAFLELVAAAGLDHPSEIRPHHVNRRISPTRVMTLAEIFPCPEPGAFLKRETVPA